MPSKKMLNDNLRKELRRKIQTFKEDLQHLCYDKHADTCTKILDGILKCAHNACLVSIFSMFYYASFFVCTMIILLCAYYSITF